MSFGAMKNRGQVSIGQKAHEVKGKAGKEHIQHHYASIEKDFEHPVPILRYIPSRSDSDYNKSKENNFFHRPAIMDV